MTEQKIIEGNKLIAEFMGGAFREINNPYYGDNPFNVVSLVMYEDGDKKFLTYEMNGLKYHRSWNWLMPVIDKIHDIDEGIVTDRNYHIEILKRYVRVIYNWNNYIMSAIDTTNRAAYSKSFEEYRYIFFDSKIEAVWFAVVKFIKFYNSCQKEK